MASGDKYEELKTRLMAMVDFTSVLKRFKVSTPMAIAFLSRSFAMLDCVTLMQKILLVALRI